MSVVGELFVKIRGDAKEFKQSLDDVKQHSNGMMDNIKQGFGTGLGIGAFTTGLSTLKSGFDGVMGGVFGMNATLETSTLQFETLMGDADKAKQHVQNLFEFAGKTPFETGPIIEASRMLETMGGASLNTMANLTLIGDAAAATSAPIEDLGVQVGRMYANMQAGKPFGEALMRLGELGVVGPQARQELEALQKSGASADEQFAALQKALGKYSGAMEKQANTWSGMVSTFKDTVSLGLAKAFEPVFAGAKQALGGINTLLSSGALTKGIEIVSNTIGSGVSKISGAFNSVLNAGKGLIGEGGAINGFFTDLALKLDPSAYGNVDKLGSFLSTLKTVLVALKNEAAQTFQPLIAAVRDLKEPLMGLVNAGMAVGAALLPTLTKLAVELGPQLLATWISIQVAGVQLIGVILELAGALMNGLAEIIKWAEKIGLVDAAISGLKTVLDAFRGLLSILMPILSSVAGFFAENKIAAIALGAAFVLLIAFLFPIPVAILALIVVIGLLRDNWDMIKNKTIEIWNAIDDHTGGTLSRMIAVFKFAFDTIKNIVETQIKVIWDIIKIVMALLHGDWEGAWNAMKDVFKHVWEGIEQQLDISLQLVKALIDSLPGFLTGIMSNLAMAAIALGLTVVNGIWNGLGDLWQIGSDIVFWIGRGITDMAGELMDIATNLVADLIEKLNPKNWFGSPKGIQNWFPYYFDIGMTNLKHSMNKNKDVLDSAKDYLHAGTPTSSETAQAGFFMGTQNSGNTTIGDINITVQGGGDTRSAEEAGQAAAWSLVSGLRMRGLAV